MVVEPHHPLSESTNEDGLQVSGSFGADEVGCDVIFKTSDSVLLYVQSSTMRRMDPRVFQSLLPVVSTQDDKEIGVIDIPERREVLEIIIHALYDRAWLSDGGSLDHLEEALDLMSTYTVRPSLHIGASSHMHGILLQHAALSPFRVYALAARHGLQDLAVRSSTYTLVESLEALTDDLASRMGAVYLRKILCLHMERRNVIKALLAQKPSPHQASTSCTQVDRENLGFAWVLAATSFLADTSSDISNEELFQAFAPLGDDLQCDDCKASLKLHIQGIIYRWSGVKRSI
ncbi:hypothetical protein CC2G_011452 [Coprinopsis cinerea AmutBmut pab1-1]|nr:hypothetical protein CC2G_011452 [Coprinopsis cinerea AmutBmut pab1-1]